MVKSAHNEALRLVDLPLLTTRRACVLADCTRSTLQRSGPAPVGKRGRTFVYRTADILEWLTSGLDRDRAGDFDQRPRASLKPASADALDRLRKLRGGTP